MKKIIDLTIITFVFATGAFAGGLYGTGITLFSDHRAHSIGDIVTIEIVETATASNEASTELKKDHSSSLDLSAGTGALDFIPMAGYNSSNSNDYSGEGKTSRKGNLKAKITAVIREILPNGNLLIEGTRIVEINGEKQITVLTGVIRPADITPNNTVFSYNIADAQITYKGSGAVQSSQRPGLFAKIVNWIF